MVSPGAGHCSGVQCSEHHCSAALYSGAAFPVCIVCLDWGRGVRHQVLVVLVYKSLSGRVYHGQSAHILLHKAAVHATVGVEDGDHTLHVFLLFTDCACAPHI